MKVILVDRGDVKLQWDDENVDEFTLEINGKVATQNRNIVEAVNTAYSYLQHQCTRYVRKILMQNGRNPYSPKEPLEQCSVDLNDYQ